MSIQTLNDIFSTVCQRGRDHVMLQRQVLGWIPISSSELYRNVAGVAHALESWGICKGDRVAILSENRPEWPIADMACLLVGAVTVPLYTTLTAEQTAFMLKDSGCRTIFVSSDPQLRKVTSTLPGTSIRACRAGSKGCY